MTPAWLRKSVVVYVLLLVACGIGYALYSGYQVDGDAISFMDIADALRAHNWPLVVNGYWNPGYAALLAVGQTIAHPDRMHEVQTFFWVNFGIFLACIAACLYLVDGLVRLRSAETPDARTQPALSAPALALLALSLMSFSFQRELSIGAVRSDTLLMLLLLLAGGCFVRVQSTGRWIHDALLGLTLGLAYLTKSFAFLPAGMLLAAIFVYGLTRRPPRRTRIAGGALLAGLIFAAVAGPYIVAISMQRGRPTTGESARLNYAFFIDQMDRWHEWHSGKLGHATADFKHHEQLLLDSPPVYSYDLHPYGTYPLWFDPSYWTDTVKPRFYLHGQIERVVRCTELFTRYLIGHLEPFAMLLVLLVGGSILPRRRDEWLPFLPIALWGCLMFAIYFLVDLQDRYLSGAYLLVLLPLFAVLRRPLLGYAGQVASTAVLLLATLSLTSAASDLASRRRFLPAGERRGAYTSEVFPAAAALAAIDVPPGSRVACFGDVSCYVDMYWARLAQTPIRAEIEVPDGSGPAAFWMAQPDRQAIVDALRKDHIAAIVAQFNHPDHIPEGWQQLGGTRFFAYKLN
jgi:hypothetical protein